MAGRALLRIIRSFLRFFVLALLLNSCTAVKTGSNFHALNVTRTVALQNESETVVAESQGHRFKAVIRLRDFTAQDVKSPEFWFGVDGDLPQRVVASIRVEKDGQELLMPPRIYTDFGDIPCESKQGRVKLFASGGDRLLLRYSGSDGAGSYTAEFHFNGKAFDHAIIQCGPRKVMRR